MFGSSATCRRSGDPSRQSLRGRARRRGARIQYRHGLKIDGVLGRDTMAELATPFSLRACTRSNGRSSVCAEFLRLPAGPLIAVNIPSFRLWGFADARDDSAAQLQMAVIVGRAVTQRKPGVHRRNALRRVQPILERAAGNPARRNRPSARARSRLLGALISRRCRPMATARRSRRSTRRRCRVSRPARYVSVSARERRMRWAG